MVLMAKKSDLEFRGVVYETVEAWRAAIAAYEGEWRKKKAECERGPGHVWKDMDWEDAYPAAAGRVCTVCDTVDLSWPGIGRVVR